MHRLIAETEVEGVFEDFAAAHKGHITRTELAEGDWAIVLHCPVCGCWDTYEVDNEARRAAREPAALAHAS